MSILTSRIRSLWSLRLVRLLVWGAAMGGLGFGVGVLLAKVFPDGPKPAELGLRWSDLLAALVAFSMVFGAIAVLFISLDARRLGRMYRIEGDASPAEAAQVRFQALVMGFSGVILALPLVFSLTGVLPVLGVGVIGLLLVLHSVMNLRVYRQTDELLRRTVLEACAATFFLGQGLLFVWAVAERMGMAPPITAWDIYAVLMTLYLAVSVTVSIRRGLA